MEAWDLRDVQKDKAVSLVNRMMACVPDSDCETVCDRLGTFYVNEKVKTSDLVLSQKNRGVLLAEVVSQSGVAELGGETQLNVKFMEFTIVCTADYARGKGLGTLLLQTAESVASKHFGIDRFFVFSTIGAMPFYYKNGYRFFALNASEPGASERNRRALELFDLSDYKGVDLRNKEHNVSSRAYDFLLSLPEGFSSHVESMSDAKKERWRKRKSKQSKAIDFEYYGVLMSRSVSKRQLVPRTKKHDKRGMNASNRGMNTDAWGAPAWYFLHSIGHTFDCERARSYHRFVCSLCDVLPCGLCRKSFKRYLEEMGCTSKESCLCWRSPTGYYRSRERFSLLLYHLHDRVNVKLNKPMQATTVESIKQLDKQYEEHRSKGCTDTGCNRESKQRCELRFVSKK